MSKALVASRLCQAMANEAADDDLDVEIYDELTNFGKEFEDLGETFATFQNTSGGSSGPLSLYDRLGLSSPSRSLEAQQNLRFFLPYHN